MNTGMLRGILDEKIKKTEEDISRCTHYDEDRRDILSARKDVLEDIKETVNLIEQGDYEKLSRKVIT